MSARAACLLFAVLAGAPPAGADVVVVTLLGTGTPRPQMDRLGAAILVEAGGDKLLFDAGRGVARRLLQVGADFGDVRRVFVTHLHYDHVVGLPDLFLTGWIYGRAHPLEVSGPAGVDPRQAPASGLRRGYPAAPAPLRAARTRERVCGA